MFCNTSKLLIVYSSVYSMCNQNMPIKVVTFFFVYSPLIYCLIIFNVSFLFITNKTAFIYLLINLQNVRIVYLNFCWFVSHWYCNLYFVPLKWLMEVILFFAYMFKHKTSLNILKIFQMNLLKPEILNKPFFIHKIGFEL